MSANTAASRRYHVRRSDEEGQVIHGVLEGTAAVIRGADRRFEVTESSGQCYRYAGTIRLLEKRVIAGY